jgi:hypothetical protein
MNRSVEDLCREISALSLEGDAASTKSIKIETPRSNCRKKGQISTPVQKVKQRTVTEQFASKAHQSKFSVPISLTTALMIENGFQRDKMRKILGKQDKKTKKASDTMQAGKANLEKVTKLSMKKEERNRQKFVELAMKL